MELRFKPGPPPRSCGSERLPPPRTRHCAGATGIWGLGTLHVSKVLRDHGRRGSVQTRLARVSAAAGGCRGAGAVRGRRVWMYSVGPADRAAPGATCPARPAPILAVNHKPSPIRLGAREGRSPEAPFARSVDRRTRAPRPEPL